MGISDKTRKNLWAKSGNRCSICKIELFSLESGKEELNIGEECHVISSKSNGPRHKPNLGDYDTYDNLLLLCRNHHKMIDELVETYTEELLRYIKSGHENWVTTTLHNSINKNKIEKPRFLARITSGKELLNIISDTHAYETDYDEVQSEEDADYIGGVFQTLTDYGDLIGMLEVYERVKIGLELNELLKDLEKNGFYLFAEKNVRKMKLESGEPMNWAVATLLIKKSDSKEIIKIDFSEPDNKGSI
jgi:hypothetical protein